MCAYIGDKYGRFYEIPLYIFYITYTQFHFFRKNPKQLFMICVISMSNVRWRRVDVLLVQYGLYANPLHNDADKSDIPVLLALGFLSESQTGSARYIGNRFVLMSTWPGTTVICLLTGN